MKRRFNDDTGAALVELAFVTPLFLFITLGAFELGRVAHYAIEVQNAARAGASYGGVNMGNAASSSNVTQAALNDAPDLANLQATPGYGCVCETLNITNGTPTFNPSTGTMSCTDPAITACTGASSTISKSVVSYITVTTSASVTPVFSLSGLPVLGATAKLPSKYNLNGYSAMRILPN